MQLQPFACALDAALQQEGMCAQLNTLTLFLSPLCPPPPSLPFPWPRTPCPSHPSPPKCRCCNFMTTPQPSPFSLIPSPQVTMRMPPSVRVLDAALQQEGMSARLKILRKALAGGEGDLPGVDMESLSATANQFVDDMEDQEVGGWGFWGVLLVGGRSRLAWWVAQVGAGQAFLAVYVW